MRGQSGNEIWAGKPRPVPPTNAPWPSHDWNRNGGSSRNGFERLLNRQFKQQTGRINMKYICLGYIEPNKFETMSESERNAMVDECFTYDDELRKNGHFASLRAINRRLQLLKQSSFTKTATLFLSKRALGQFVTAKDSRLGSKGFIGIFPRRRHLSGNAEISWQCSRTTSRIH